MTWNLAFWVVLGTLTGRVISPFVVSLAMLNPLRTREVGYLVKQSELLYHVRPDNVGRVTWIHKYTFNLKCIYKERDYQCVVVRPRQALDVLVVECESILRYVTSSSLFSGDGYFCPSDHRFLWGIDASQDHVDDMLWLICFIHLGRLSFLELIFGPVTEEFLEVTFAE